MNTPAFGVTPLGVTIARKQQQQQQQQQQGEPDDSDSLRMDKPQVKKTPSNRHSRHKRVVSTTTTTMSSDTHKKNGKPKNASWMALVEGVTLYGLCLVLPSMAGILMRLDRAQVTDVLQAALQRHICPHSAWICWNIFGLVLEEKVDTPVLTFDKFVAPNYVSDIYVIAGLTLGMAMMRVLLVHWLVPNHLAPQQMEAIVRCKSIHLLSAEYKQSMTPRAETPRKVIGLERLAQPFNSRQPSSSLPSLPSLPPMVPQWDSPLKTKKNSSGDGDGGGGIVDNAQLLQQTASYSLNMNTHQHHDHDSTGDLIGLSMDTPMQSSRPTLQMGSFLQSCSPFQADDTVAVDDGGGGGFTTPTRSSPMMATPLSHMVPPFPHLEEEEDGNQQGPMEEEENFDWKRRGSTASLAAAAAAAVQEDEDHDHSADEDHDHDTHSAAHRQQDATTATGSSLPSQRVRRPQRLFAAPRYATAVFRLLYCTLSCTMAWYLFRDADFWPSYVGGHGLTARCWDLSGSLALARNLDRDFDHRNTVLRRFFLVQASYHLHSGAFHVFSVLLLFLLKKEDVIDTGDETKDLKRAKKKDWVSLLRSLVPAQALFKHTLSLVFLSVSYVFSSLRRLGAIGMFALDMSSWAMHLLQTCLNAPTDSVLSQPKVIRGVWAFMVVPSFLYFRFWVWPLLGKSAMVESEQWLAQLESTLVPGSALWFRRTFQVWMALWMGFHAIHFKRLVFHPHLQRIMLTSKQEGNAPQAAKPQDARP